MCWGVVVGQALTCFEFSCSLVQVTGSLGTWLWTATGSFGLRVMMGVWLWLRQGAYIELGYSFGRISKICPLSVRSSTSLSISDGRLDVERGCTNILSTSYHNRYAHLFTDWQYGSANSRIQIHTETLHIYYTSFTEPELLRTG